MAKEPKERKAFEAHMRVGGYSNHDKHPDGSYVSSAMELWWQGWKARAQLPSQGGEAVEVVATVEAYGGKWAGIHWGECIGSTEDPERQLMTVAQHQRILAAAYQHESVVPVRVTGSLDEIDAQVWPFINAEAQKVGAEFGRIETYGYELANGGVVVLWSANKVHAMAVTIRDDANRTRCIRMLAETHPADQVAKGVVVQEMEWLEQWLLLAAEPIGQECCGRAHLECCGNSEPVYRTADEIAAAMNARREELRALLEQKP